jgi:hypothetical protein
MGKWYTALDMGGINLSMSPSTVLRDTESVNDLLRVNSLLLSFNPKTQPAKAQTGNNGVGKTPGEDALLAADCNYANDLMPIILRERYKEIST